MRVEEVIKDPLMDLTELKRIVDEACAKAPPGTKVLFRGGGYCPEDIKSGIFATHISSRSGYLERMSDEKAENDNRESERDRWFKLDTPVFLLIERDPDENELAVP